MPFLKRRGIVFFILIPAFPLWSSSLCHSLVPHTIIQLLSKRKLSESEFPELQNEQNFFVTFLFQDKKVNKNVKYGP